MEKKYDKYTIVQLKKIRSRLPYHSLAYQRLTQAIYNKRRRK